MHKILFVIGTRPEAIKMAPLIKKLQSCKEFDAEVCVTAQHREMLDRVLSFFEIQPKYDLNIMKDNQDLFDITTRILSGMKTVLNESSPDMVLVHGDTTTTFTASLSAFYQQIPVAHIEAGLRTGSMFNPWPEEANRSLTTRLCKLHFAPTKRNFNNLIKENIKPETIFVTGNTITDSLLYVIDKLDSNDSLNHEAKKTITVSGYPFIQRIEKLKKKMILVTGHRRENFGEGFLSICDSLKKIAKKYPNIDIVYPVHLNPNVQQPVGKALDDVENIFLIDPLDYIPFVYLMKHCTLVLTDSGGIQEEAPMIGKPVLVMRKTTERPEAVEAGTVKLVGTEVEKIVSEVSELLENKSHYQKMSKAHNPYGNGLVSDTIAEILLDKFNIEKIRSK